MIFTILVAVGFVAGVLAVAAWAARLPNEERSFLPNAGPTKSNSQDHGAPQKGPALLEWPHSPSAH
jgi:hypothetical protein